MKIVVKLDNTYKVRDGIEPVFPSQAVVEASVDQFNSDERNWLMNNGFFGNGILFPNETKKGAPQDEAGFVVEDLSLDGLKFTIKEHLDLVAENNKIVSIT